MNSLQHKQSLSEAALCLANQLNEEKDVLKMEKSLYLTTLPRFSSSDRFDHGVECAFGLQFRSSSFFLRGVCLPRVLRPYPTVLPISPESGKSKTLRSSLLVSDSASNRAKLTHWRNWSTWPRNTIRQLVLHGRRPVLRWQLSAWHAANCTQRSRLWRSPRQTVRKFCSGVSLTARLFSLLAEP